MHTVTGSYSALVAKDLIRRAGKIRLRYKIADVLQVLLNPRLLGSGEDNSM